MTSERLHYLSVQITGPLWMLLTPPDRFRNLKIHHGIFLLSHFNDANICFLFVQKENIDTNFRTAYFFNFSLYLT